MTHPMTQSRRRLIRVSLIIALVVGLILSVGLGVRAVLTAPAVEAGNGPNGRRIQEKIVKLASTKTIMRILTSNIKPGSMHLVAIYWRLSEMAGLQKPHVAKSDVVGGQALSNISVSTVGGLNSALSTAHSGDTILLAAGSYSGVSLQNLNFESGVTITSQDPNHEAVLVGLKLTNDSGLKFSNLELTTVGVTDGFGMRITGVQNVQFDHLNVHGSAANINTTQAFLIRDSSNVSVTNSDFHELYTAISHLDSDHLTFSGNNIHDIRLDGIRGGGSSNVTVTNNTFSDFHAMTGDHDDAIQFWTSGTTVAAHDIVVSGNVVTRGTGDPIQGIFFKDEVGTLPYNNVHIENNTITGGSYNAITLQGGKNVDIGGNAVTSYADQNSYIRVESTTNAAVHDNGAMLYMYKDNTGLRDTHNLTDPKPLRHGVLGAGDGAEVDARQKAHRSADTRKATP